MNIATIKCTTYWRDKKPFGQAADSHTHTHTNTHFGPLGFALTGRIVHEALVSMAPPTGR